jgi:hypothetical protein
VAIPLSGEKKHEFLLIPKTSPPNLPAEVTVNEYNIASFYLFAKTLCDFEFV